MNKSVFKDGNNQAQTNSLLATEKFGKEHRNVLQAIRGSLGPAGNSADLRMFTETTYVCELDFKSPNFGELKPYLSKSPLKERNSVVMQPRRGKQWDNASTKVFIQARTEDGNIRNSEKPINQALSKTVVSKAKMEARKPAK